MKISGNKQSSQSLNCREIPGVKTYGWSRFPATTSTSKTLSMQVRPLCQHGGSYLSNSYYQGSCAAVKRKGLEGGGESRLLPKINRTKLVVTKGTVNRQ